MENTQRRARMELVAYDTCKNLNTYGKILIADFAKITTLYPSLTAAYKVENTF